MKTRQLLLKLAKKFPKRYAKKEGDFVGLMTGKLPEEIHNIVLCLDFDWQVLPFIEEKKPDIIITHHPFIYGSKSKVFKLDKSKEALCQKVDDLGIPVYSYHTNFDRGKDGMNDALAEALELGNVYSPVGESMMRIGYLKEEMPIRQFANYAKTKLGMDYGLLLANGRPMIKKVGIIGGGGSKYWPIAKEEGCDIYISGDAPHHIRRAMVNENFNYLDIPHEVEKIFMPQMKKILLEIEPSFNILTVDYQKLPEVI